MSNQNFKIKNGLSINGVEVINSTGTLVGPALTNSNSASSYANSAYNKANTSTILAQAAFDTANNSTDTWVRTAANSASSYANSAYDKANTAITSLAGYATESYVGTAISNLVDSAPTTLDTLNELAAALGDDANFSTTISNMVGVSGGYANSAYSQANTASVNASSAFNKANLAFGPNSLISTTLTVSSVMQTPPGTGTTNYTIDINPGVIAYMNSAFNTANSGGSYANSAFNTANTASVNATSAGSYANSAFNTANTASVNATSAGSYANSAYTKANTGTILAQAAFDTANTKLSSVPNSNTQVSSLGVGTAASGTTGEIRATNNITGYYSSDARLKENIKDVDNPLDIVCVIGSKSFDWTDEYIASKGGEDGYFIQKSDFGVIAQDVQAVFPQAVRTREDGTLAVDYEKLATLSFGAIKQLVKRIEDLENK